MLKMDSVNLSEDEIFSNLDAEDEFRSCCTEEEEWEDTEESLAEGSKDVLDEFSARMFFKGISVTEVDGKEMRASGIGVVMERAPGVPLMQVQKKLDFFVEGLVAEHLALMDGMLAALQSGVRRVYAFTNSEKVYYQIAETELLEDQLLVALGHRILELADKFEDFDLKLVSNFELERSLQLAKKAIGVWTVDNCLICGKEKLSSRMLKMSCSHKVCSDCMTMYVERKLRTSQVRIRCPQQDCRYYISAKECKPFIPVAIYELLERAAVEAGAHNSDGFYCPFPNCSMLLNRTQYLSSRASSSSQTDVICMECPECRRDICINCGVPWHPLMTCEEYQNLPEQGDEDIAFHALAQNNRWRCCQECRRMIELTQGCRHVTCRCGHEFCYSCGAEYRHGVQTCQCAFWDEDNLQPPVVAPNQESDLWAWDSFDSLPTAVDGYSEQERAQLALIQRFLAGGFSLADHNPCQSPPRCSDSYMDTMKDLHQLPWLERFVSVISDSYSEDFIQ